MSKPAKQPDVLQRMNDSHLSPLFELPLDQLRQLPEDYRHRPPSELDHKSPAMQTLMDSLRTEGLLEPLLVYRGESGAYVQISGHRRRWALEALADQNVDGFRRDMLVSVREVLGGSSHDYLLHSYLDNEREPISELYKVKAAVKFLAAGCDHTRIKACMGLADSTFDRYRRLAHNPWMLGHVERDEVGLATAHLLLESAGGAGGQAALEHLRKDLALKVAMVRERIAVKRAEAAARDKELGAADATVRNYFAAHEIRGWAAALRRGERLPRRAHFKYAAGVVKDRVGKRLVIPAITLPLVEGELERLAEVFVQLDKTLKDARPVIESLARQRAALNLYTSEDGPADYASAGLDAVADVLQPAGPTGDWCDPGDRERTLDEVNRNYDREAMQDEQVREGTPVPITAGLEVPDVQPPDTDPALTAQVERMSAQLKEDDADAESAA